MYKKHRARNRINKSSTEEDVIAFLDHYFDDFEQNLRDNNFDKMNTYLVKNIIAKFGKIFHLWDQNRIFQHSIDKKDMVSIYQLMHQVFGIEQRQNYDPIDTNDFTLECNHCGETFPLRNNDCKYSYDEHSLSETHLEFMKNLNIDHSDADTASSAESDSDIDYVDAYEQLFIYARCNLCYNRITFGDFDYNEEAVVAKAIMTHLETTPHRRNANVFRNNKRYIDEVNLKKNIYKCTLCDQDFFMDDLIEHFQSTEHRSKATTAGNTSEITTNSRAYDYVPMLQSRINNILYPSEEGGYVKLASLCIDKEKHPTVSESKTPIESSKKKKKKKKREELASLEKILISVFDANCLIIKKGVIRCKICESMFKCKSNLITHMTGKEHLKNIKRYESCFGNFVKETDDVLQCTLCHYKNAGKYKNFFTHCQTNGHQERIKQLKFQPNVKVEGENAKEIKCPVLECTIHVSGLSQLFEHVKTHGIII